MQVMMINRNRLFGPLLPLFLIAFLLPAKAVSREIAPHFYAIGGRDFMHIRDTLYKVDIKTRQVLASFEHPKKYLLDLAITTDGDQLFALNEDSEILALDAERLSLRYQFPITSKEFPWAQILFDHPKSGLLYLTRTTGKRPVEVAIADPGLRKVLKILKLESSITGGFIYDSGRDRIYVAASDPVAIIDPQAQQVIGYIHLKPFEKYCCPFVTDLLLLPKENEILIYASSYELGIDSRIDSRPALYLYDPDQAALILRSSPFPISIPSLRDLALSHDGGYLFAATSPYPAPGTGVLVDTKTLTILDILTFPEPVREFFPAPDGLGIWMAALSGRVYRLDEKTGDLLEPVFLPFRLWKLIMPQDNQKIQLRDEDKQIEVEPRLSVEEILDELKSPEVRLRQQAALKLGKLKDPRALPRLLSALKDPEPPVRWASAKAITNLGPVAVDALVEILKDPDPILRWTGAHILEKIADRKAKIPLEGLLDDKEAAVRLAAIEAIRRIGDPSSIKPLSKTLKDPEYAIRLATIQVLAGLGPEAIEALSQALHDPDETIRRTTIDLLKSFGPLAIDPLVPALDDKASEVRKAALAALGDIGDSRVITAIEKGLKDNERSVREIAVKALGRIKDPRVIDLLTSVLRKDIDDVVRWEAVKQLGITKDPRALGPLTWALNHKDEHTRFLAAEALATLGVKEAIEPLKRRLKKEKNRDVRRSIIFALADFKDPDALPHLIKLLEDRKGWVRADAARELVKLGAKGAIPPLQERLKVEEDEQMQKVFTDAIRSLEQLSE